MNPPVGVSDPALGVPLWAIGSYLAGALGAWLWLRLVPRLGFLDRPGARRLHRQPTPRGGGLGIVAAALLALLLLEPAGEASLAIASAGAALAVVGLYDDWRGAGVAMRLLVQLAAAAIAAAAVAGPSASLVPLLGAALALTLWLNLFNFMDGADGMAAQQAVFLAGALTVLAGLAGAGGWALFALAVGAATLGFLPFNLPRARLFLGDVGSTTLGFFLGAAALALVARGHLGLLEALLLGSAFLIDGGATLASRVLRGKRWYTAHREHLYQWLVRSGLSHVEVAARYAAWNLVIVAPLLALGRLRPEWQPVPALCALALGLTLWILGRRWALARLRGRG